MGVAIEESAKEEFDEQKFARHRPSSRSHTRISSRPIESSSTKTSSCCLGMCPYPGTEQRQSVQ